MHRILRADPVSLTSRCSLSPLDADPSRRLPRVPAPCCEEPWAAVRAQRPSPAPCDMRPSLTGAGTCVSRNVAGGGGRATVARPDLRETAPELRRRTAQPCGEAHPGPTPHGKARSAAPTSRRLRLSVTSPPGGRGAQPPASLRGTMKSGPTGQMRSSNPPARLRGVAPGLAGLGLGPDRTERRSRSVHKSAKTASRRWFGAFVYTVAIELRWVTRVSQPPWDACGTDGVLLQQGTHSTRREDQMCVACVYPAHFYLLALDARRGRCRCDVSESLTSQS